MGEAETWTTVGSIGVDSATVGRGRSSSPAATTDSASRCSRSTMGSTRWTSDVMSTDGWQRRASSSSKDVPRRDAYVPLSEKCM